MPVADRPNRSAATADSLPDVTMSDALTATWKAIRRRHPKVPDATVSVAPGRGSSCGSVAWDAGMPVIMVGAQTIAEGPLAILEDLLHQAAHGLLRAAGHRSGDDAKHYPDEHSEGNAGRYHNKSYRDAAQSLGLKAEWTRGGTGWSATTASDDLAGSPHAANASHLGPSDCAAPMPTPNCASTR